MIAPTEQGENEMRRVPALEKALRWALDYIRDGHDESRNPPHACEFVTNPERGACDFCEAWGDAYEALTGGRPASRYAERAS